MSYQQPQSAANNVKLETRYNKIGIAAVLAAARQCSKKTKKATSASS